MNRKLYLWLLTLVLAVILSNTTQAQRFQVILGPGQIAENQSCWPQPLVHDYEAVWMQNTGIPKYAIGFCIDAHKKRPDVNGSYYDFANATYCGGDHGCYGPFLAYVNTGHAGETVDMCGSSAGRQNMGICVISPDNLANKTICQGQSVVLQGSCLKGTLRWFDSNGGNFANGNPTVAPGSTTTYYATCYSTFGASGSYYAPYANVPCETPRVPVTVTVNPKPAAPPNPGWKTICTGESVTLSSSCSGSSIRWMKDGGSVIGTSNSITVNPTVTNTAYYAQCVGSNGCGSDIIGLRVVVNPRAAAPVTTPMSVCPGETITLPGTCSSAGSSIEWYSDSNLSTRISNTIKPSATATYYARCFDSKGCHSPTSSVVVTMKAGGVSLSQSDFTKTDATSCTSPNGTIKICNLIQNVSYTVKFNKNNRPQTPQTLTADGSGCITLVGLSEATYDNFNVTNNGSGCSSGPLYGVSLTVLNTAKPTFTAIAHTPAVCGEAGYIDISGLTPGSLYTVSYKKDGVAQHPFSFSADSTGFRWDDPGAGSFVITLTNGFCVSNTMTVVLGDGPQPFNISAYPYNPTVCQGTDGKIYVQGLGSPKTYTMYYSKDGVPQTPITFDNPVGSPVGRMIDGLTAGTYTIKLKDTQACSSNETTVTLYDVGAPRIDILALSYPGACGDSTGAITITGLAPGKTYTILYSKNGIEQTPLTYTATSDRNYTISTLTSGVYSNIHIIDQNCESNRLSATLDDPGNLNIMLGAVVQPTGCGQANGSITIKGLINGQQYQLFYVKDGVTVSGGTFTATGFTYTINSLGSGAYTGIVVKQGVCSSNALTASLFGPGVTLIQARAVNTSTCAGTDGQIIITGLTAGVNYTLNYAKNGVAQPAVSITPTSSSYTISNLTAGDYTDISVTQSSCTSNKVNVSIKDPAGPEAPVASGATICAGTSATLTATCKTGTLKWYSNSSLSTEVTSTTVSPAATTTYYAVCVTNQCKSAGTPAVITVTPGVQKPTVNSPLAICLNDSTTLSANCAAGTLKWFSDSTLTIELSNTKISPQSDTTFYAICSTAQCSSATSKLKITVNPLPQFTVALGTCDAQTQTYSATVTMPAGATLSSTKGTVAGNTISGIPSDVLTTIKVTSAAGCMNQTEIYQHCKPVCNPPTPVIANSSVTICAKDSVVLTATGCGSNYGYEWSTDYSLASYKVAPSTTTTYFVHCKGEAGCVSKDSAVVTVTVKPRPTITLGTPQCAANRTYSVSVTATAGAVITSSSGTVSGNNVTGIPSGTTATITATLNGCSASKDTTFTCAGVFDLALRKVLPNGAKNPTVLPGSTVTFNIKVYNQGNVDATNVSLVDYIPAGLTLADASWTAAGSNATLNTPIASLVAGDSVMVPIKFTVNAGFTGNIRNFAEISGANNTNNLNDIDSTPDSNPSNDGTPKDDVVNEDHKNNPTQDEDDHDYEDINVACVKPVAGTDQNICSPATTASLTGFSPAGGTWSAQTGNPAAAIVTNAGAVSGMSAVGTYKFIYSLNGCSDTVSVIIKPKPVAGADQSICAPATTASLTGFSPAGGTWSAQTGNPASATVTNAGAVSGMSAAGTYKFIYTLNGCSDTVSVIIKPKPVAGADQSLACANASTNTLQTTTSLTGFSPAGGAWSAMGGNPATAAVTNAGAVSGMNVAGVYQFIYTVNGCSDTVRVTVQACAGCTKPSAGTDQSLCSPAATTSLTGFSPAGGTWSAQTGNPAGATVTNAGLVSGMSAVGTYRFIYSVTSGGQTCSDTVSVIIKPKPVAGADQSICAPATTASLTGFSPAGGTWSVQTGNPAAAIVTNAGAVSGMSAAGTYKFIYTLNGCADTVSVIIKPKPVAGADQSLACANASTNTLQTTTSLTGFSPAGGTWSAMGGNPATAAVTNAGAVSGMNVAGVYQFIYTVNGCSDTVRVTVQACVGCTKPSAGTDQSLCSPMSTTNLTGFSPAGGTWSAQMGNPAGATVTNAGAVTGMSVVGTYRFIYSVTSGGQTCSDTVSVIIKPKPVAGTDQSLCSPATTTSLTGFSPAGGMWSAQTGNPAAAIVTNAGAVSGMSAAGTYKFIYTLNGCSDTVSVIIKPKPVAGTDQTLTCTSGSITSTSLTGFSPAGGTWSAMAGNPATAAVTNAGAVSGMSVAGTYKFIYSLNGCADTVSVQVPSCSFDLALRKVLPSGSKNPTVAPGDTVTFNVVVYNQGNVDATNVRLVDYIPAGLTLADASWTASGSNATLNTPIASLAAGASVTRPIRFVVNAGFTGSIRNFAEISGAENAKNLDDIDSTPDSNPNNDGTPKDDVINEDHKNNPTQDEDDADYEDITVSPKPVFDLALRKVLPSGSKNPTVAPGDTVTFNVVVYNQGNVDATNVRLVDYIPAGLTLADANWTASGSNATLNTPIASLAAGASVTRPIRFVVNAGFTGSIRNFAEISGAENAKNLDDIDSTPDSNPNNDGTPKDDVINEDHKNNPTQDEDDADYEDITVSPKPVFDLALRKVLPSGSKNPTVAPGDTVTFNVVVYNQGNVDATNVRLVDYIPAGLTLADANWTASGSNATLNTPIASLAAGASVTRPIRFVVNAGFTGSIRNFAEINGAENAKNLDDIDSTPDSNPNNDGTPKDDVINEDHKNNPGQDEDDSDYEDITVSPKPVFDLAMRKVLPSGAKNPTVAPGDTVTFNVVVYNQGNVDATNVRLVDYIPAGLTLADANWTASGSNATLNTPIASLAAGASVTRPIRFVVNAGFTGSIRNFAEISGAENAKNLDDIDSTPDSNPNNDGTPKDDVINEDHKNNPGQDEDDSDYEDITVSPKPVFDLGLRKVLPSGAKNPTVAPGDTVTFNVVVYNQGNVDATNVRLVDYIPAGLTLADANWTASGSNATLNTPIASLAAGASVTRPIRFVVNAGFTGSIRNFAEISGAENANNLDDIDSTPDSNPNNDGTPKDDVINEDHKNNPGQDEDDSDYEDITVSPKPVFDLAMRKVLPSGSKNPTVAPGDTVTFNVVVYNQGNVDATNVRLVDYIPAGLTLADANWTASGNNATLNTPIASLAAGASVTRPIRFVVNAGFTGSIRNFAEISGAENAKNLDDIDSTPDSNPSNDGTPKDDVINEDHKNNPTQDEDDADYEDITVSPKPVFDLGLRKVLPSGSKNPTVAPGDTVTFNVVVYNQGNVDATNVRLVDYIPAGLTLADANWTASGSNATLNTPIASLAAGASVTRPIRFVVNAGFTGSIRNFAEISGAENAKNLDDIDSTPDSNPSNDGTPKDDVINEDHKNNPTQDEDDSDYEDITVSPKPVFDLGLRKVLPSGAKNPTVAPGDTVTFNVVVYNQGNVDATNVRLVDYIPAGLTLADANWTASGSNATLNTPIASLAAGSSVTRPIRFVVNAGFTGSIRNFAEISGAQNAKNLDDIDSTPDSNPNNDGTPKDDVINEDHKNNPGQDEDDSDYEDITVSPKPVFDLGLRKVLPSGSKNPTVAPGDTVTFNVVVYNQGNVDATNVRLVDYIPAGLTLADANWTASGSNATLNTPIASLAAGASVTRPIRFVVNAGFTGSIRNFAEISGAQNAKNLDDIDSTPDSNPSNDGAPKDDVINEDHKNNPTQDEDDADYEDITVAPKPCKQELCIPFTVKIKRK